MTDIRIPASDLRALVARIFAAAGCDGPEAERIAHYLVIANLTGHDSHGVVRVPRYVDWLRTGHVRAGQGITVVHETAVTATVDGNNGFGQTVAPLAVDLGIQKAHASGLAAVALRHAGHIGRVGDWGERAAAAGLIALHFVNVFGSELVAPFGGTQRQFGTNPVCIAIPAPGLGTSGAGGTPLVLDLATSMVAEGKVLVAARGGTPVPHGALIGPDGALSSDPAALYGATATEGVPTHAAGLGALRAFGEHKGSGIAFMCEVLAGLVSGGGTSGPVPASRAGGINNGMFSVYARPEAFGADPAAFAASVQSYADRIRATRPADPAAPVLIPGDMEAARRRDREANGVPLQAATWDTIRTTAAALRVPAPDAPGG